MEPVLHGRNGWVLEDMDWDPDTGVSTFLYSRKQPGSVEEIAEVSRSQPTEERHSGWASRREQHVFTV